MVKNTINTFISSANRNVNDTVYDFVVDFPLDNVIKCNDSEYIKMNVVSFDMLNTMYNIKDTQIVLNGYQNNVPEEEYSLKFKCIVPDGNYNVYSFKKWFEEEATGVWYDPYGIYSLNGSQFKATDFFTITKYNISQNTFTFKIIPSIDNNGYIRDYWTYYLSPCKFLGISETGLVIPYEEEVTGGYVNLVNYKKIILRTQNINYFSNNIENVNTVGSQLSFSDIIFWKSKQDIEPFKNISYSNEDGGNSFNLTLQDKHITNMRLQLKNEFGQFITDAPDYLLVIQFTIHEKEEWLRKTITTMAENVRDIWVSFLFVMEKLKLLK